MKKNLTLKAILEDRITEKIEAERMKIIKDMLKKD